jgi:hypothetical protein
MSVKNPCCEYAELAEISAAGHPTCIVAFMCPVCGQVETTAEWDKLSERVRREMSICPSPQRLMPLSA